MIRISGFDALARKLRKISTENATALLDSAFADGADVMVEAAIQRAPKATGNLAKKVKIKKGRKRRGIVRRIISFNSSYAFHVETGTKTQPARPFLRTAFNLTAPRIVADIERRAERELSR
jgi:HK97 gp10 family phage protein